MEANNNSIQKVLLEFEKHRDVENQDIDFYSKADLIFLRKIIETTIKNQESIDKNITQSIKKDWTMDRIDPTLRAFLELQQQNL